jgi:Flp pilus assembly protein TadD
VSMTLQENRPDAARERVEKQIALAPQSGALRFLLGNVYWNPREGGTRRSCPPEGARAWVGPYLALSQRYADSGKYDQALAKLREALTVNPNNIVALALSAGLSERKGEITKAKEAYEKALALNPRSALAANNLAYLYSEHGGDKKRALQLAQAAKEMAPEEPHIADTLGWILYKRGVYQRAFSLFKESAAKLPENPEIQYHLGMAYLKTGDKEAARKALTLAATSQTGFGEQEDAKRALTDLK